MKKDLQGITPADVVETLAAFAVAGVIIGEVIVTVGSWLFHIFGS